MTVASGSQKQKQTPSFNEDKNEKVIVLSAAFWRLPPEYSQDGASQARFSHDAHHGQSVHRFITNVFTRELTVNQPPPPSPEHL